MASVLFFSLLFSLLSCPNAQNLSTSLPVPPLQWINLSSLLQGSSGPPPLRDAVVGYDDTSRSLIVFGGVSQSGVAQSQTYLLNLQTLTWSVPSPPFTSSRTPPARSLALSGGDFAASNRHGFIVIGGKDSNNQPLSDVWEYDFNNQFWSSVNLSPGGPSPRWGASGGIDIRTPAISDPIIPGPNNTFFLAGGFDGKTVDNLSDVWQLKLSGTLSSNLPNDVDGSWKQVTIKSLPGRVGEASTVVGQEIIASGGCTSSQALSATNITCATQDSFIIDVENQLSIAPGACPAPRVAPVLVPNFNKFSTSFASQVFLLLGTFNTSQWNDSNGLVDGEVAILDINTGTWARAIPSGDPTSNPRVPSPRQGAAAISFSQALVGSSRTSSTDVLVFGGQDSNGNFLSELWMLRAYNGVLSPSNTTFASGALKAGVNADGSGVQISFLTQCASLLATPTSNPTGISIPSSTSSAKSPTMTGSNPSQSSSTFETIHDTFNTSFSHKILLPLSLLLLTPVILFFRWARATPQLGWLPAYRVPLVFAFMLLGIASYIVGIVGFVLAFTSISSSSSSRSVHFKTGHGIAGLIFFSVFYVLIPLLAFVVLCAEYRRSFSSIGQPLRSDLGNTASLATDEKFESVPMRPRSRTPSLQNTTPPATPRPRAMSWDTSMKLRLSTHDDGGLSSDSPPSSTPTPLHTGFEVLNRGHRPRKLSGPWETASVPGGRGRVPSTRRLGEIDWLLRRRSLNAVGELDYAITQAHNTRYYATGAVDAEPAMPTEFSTVVHFPVVRNALVHLFTHLSLLGLSAVTLSALFMHARLFLFILFLLWITAFYIGIFLLAWHGRPGASILTAIVWRLRGLSPDTAPSTLAPDSDLPASTILHSSIPELTPSSAGGLGPYTHHRPPVRTSMQLDELPYVRGTPLSVASDDNDDDDLDEDTRQRLIEEEMERRDVSIVTVPRRKLYLTNPS